LTIFATTSSADGHGHHAIGPISPASDFRLNLST
jgi:hypothetical protein